MMTPQPYDEIVAELTRQGMTRREVMEATGLSKWKVETARKRTGVHGMNRGGVTSPLTPEQRARVESLARSNMSYMQIARAVGVSEHSVWRVKKRMGLTTSRQDDLAPHAERLEQAREMIADGASFAETIRTTHISRERLRVEFPGKQWTQQQAVDMAVAVRQANRKMRRGGLDITSVGL